MTEKKRLIYFPGLNGIRGIAALIVVVFHINQFLNLFGIGDYQFKFTNMAAHGVTIFFALSGFLITYLLLEEKNRFNTISVKKFYIRRIFRIWPLYYFAVLLSLVLMNFIPGINSSGNLVVSFGLYVYHMFVIVVSASFLKNILPNNLLGVIIVYANTLVFTSLISHLSYQYFELGFIKRKERFSKIMSKSSKKL